MHTPPLAIHIMNPPKYRIAIDAVLLEGEYGV